MRSSRATGNSQLPILRRRLWWIAFMARRFAYLPPLRFGICALERDWTLLPNTVFACFSTTWA